LKSFFAARPRIASLILALIGFVLTYVNYRTVLNEHNFYPMLMLFGPVCVLVGIAGAIDPRVLNQTAIQTNRTRAIARIVLVVLVVAGMGIGWATAHFWYHIW